MQRLYSSSDPLLIGHLKTVLEQHHIGCFTKNAYLLGAAGELPPTEAWPQLWVEDDADFERAREIIAGVLEEDGGGPPWTCRRCGEESEPQFAECWRCGAAAPS
jgi:hypothetical protein